MPFHGAGWLSEDKKPYDFCRRPLFLGIDYTDQEFEEAEPSEYQLLDGLMWISPPSKLTERRLQNLDNNGLLGDVHVFLPFEGQLANDPGKGIYACPFPEKPFELTNSPATQKRKKKTKAGRVKLSPTEDPICIRDAQEVPVCRHVQLVKGKGKAIVEEIEEESSDDDDTPSILVELNAPPHERFQVDVGELFGSENILLPEFLLGNLLKEFTKSMMGKAKIERVKKELAEKKKALELATRDLSKKKKKVKELTQQIAKIPSTAQLEKELEESIKMINGLKVEKKEL
uniref:Uncharacterized protein n=1 Tax=Cannabis sativa TaxID=3483 RepID=A0A803QIP6_CANSA